jgi:hypothetical protein
MGFSLHKKSLYSKTVNPFRLVLSIFYGKERMRIIQ